MRIVLLLCLSLISIPSYAVEHLKLSTTTSTDNSGLLALLHPVFEAKYNVKVDVIAVGTGKALRIGNNGDVDVVLVHAPEAELHYVQQGDFIDRQAVMHNDFVIVGANTDPAHLKQATSAQQAFKLIAQKQSKFISRGDDSGTHKKERSLWQSADIETTGDWYIQAGQGMGAVLTMADELQAYTLTDRATQLAFANKTSLVTVFEGDPSLFNPYHVMAVNPAKHPHIHYDLAIKYINFITSEQGQKIIANFTQSGQPLFYPETVE